MSRQAHFEARAADRPIEASHGAPAAFGNRFHDGEAQSRMLSIALIRPVAEESFKDTIGVLRGDPRTFVADPDESLPSVRQDLDEQLSSCRRKAHGIVDQVVQDLQGALRRNTNG